MNWIQAKLNWCWLPLFNFFKNILLSSERLFSETLFQGSWTLSQISSRRNHLLLLLKSFRPLSSIQNGPPQGSLQDGELLLPAQSPGIPSPHGTGFHCWSLSGCLHSLPAATSIWRPSIGWERCPFAIQQWFLHFCVNVPPPRCSPTRIP